MTLIPVNHEFNEFAFTFILIFGKTMLNNIYQQLKITVTNDKFEEYLFLN